MGFAVAHPLAGQKALDALQSGIDRGLVGFGEFLPQAQGYTLKEDSWLKVVELAINCKVPINLHVTEPVGKSYKGRIETPLADYQWLAQNYPECTFIFAHWGGLLPFYELNPAVKQALSNVYYDTAASPLLYDKSIYRRVVDTIGSDRILFGTDYPLLLKPGNSRTPSFTPILEELNAASLSEQEVTAILSGNARKLFI